MGTAVTSESGITSLEVQDFYLVAHKALQGTSKPLRYILLAHGWAMPDKHKSVPKEYEMTEGALLFIFLLRDSCSLSAQSR